MQVTEEVPPMDETALGIQVIEPHTPLLDSSVQPAPDTPMPESNSAESSEGNISVPFNP